MPPFVEIDMMTGKEVLAKKKPVCPECGSEYFTHHDCQGCKVEYCEEPDRCADCFEEGITKERRNYTPQRCACCGHEEKVKK